MTSSWFNPKTEKRTSPIQGRGLFARNAIAAGEIVAVKGGAIMDLDALALIRDEVSPAEIQIEDGLYIVPRSAAEVEQISCASITPATRTSAFAAKSHLLPCVIFLWAKS